MSKATGPKARSSKAASKSGAKSATVHDQKLTRGNGGELHQVAGGKIPVLTTAQGGPVSDDQNSLKTGARGPTLLEDFHFREKIFHFDHERIPERVVHARGYGAHGFFETYKSLSRYTAPTSSSAPARRRRPSCASRPSPAARARWTWRATCAASRSSSTPGRATGTSSATTSRCSSSRTRSASPISSMP